VRLVTVMYYYRSRLWACMMTSFLSPFTSFSFPLPFFPFHPFSFHLFSFCYFLSLFFVFVYARFLFIFAFLGSTNTRIYFSICLFMFLFVVGEGRGAVFPTVRHWAAAGAWSRWVQSRWEPVPGTHWESTGRVPADCLALPQPHRRQLLWRLHTVRQREISLL